MAILFFATILSGCLYALPASYTESLVYHQKDSGNGNLLNFLVDDDEESDEDDRDENDVQSKHADPSLLSAVWNYSVLIDRDGVFPLTDLSSQISSHRRIFLLFRKLII